MVPPCPLPPSDSNSPRSWTARARPCRDWPPGWPRSMRRSWIAACRAAGSPKSPARPAAGSPPWRAISWPPRCTPDGGWPTSTRPARSPRATGPHSARTRDCGSCGPPKRRAARGAPTCCCAAARLVWWCSTGRQRSRARWPCDWCASRAPATRPSCCSRPMASTRVLPAPCSCACSARRPSDAPTCSISPRGWRGSLRRHPRRHPRRHLWRPRGPARAG